MDKPFNHLLQLGLAIVIMSTSGVLGRYIQLPPPIIIWIRCVIGAVALYLFLSYRKTDLGIGSRRQFWAIVLSSILLGLHWISYFYSLKLSNVAIGMLSLFTYPVITALLEPIMLKIRMQWSSLILGGVALIGVSLLVPELDMANDHTLGILVGIFSALCYSIRNIILKKRITEQSGITLMFHQLLILSLILWPVIFLFDYQTTDLLFNWKALLILGLLTTAAGHTLFVLSFKHFTISTVSVISALTPLIGTLLGFVFLDEVPANRTFAGGLIIFITVIAASVLSVRRDRVVN